MDYESYDLMSHPITLDLGIAISYNRIRLHVVDVGHLVDTETTQNIFDFVV